MNDIDMTFSDFVSDKDGEFSKAQFLSVANQLVEQGRNPGRVFLAMYRAAAMASIEHSISEHYRLVKAVHDEVIEYLPKLDADIDQLLSRQNAQ